MSRFTKAWLIWLGVTIVGFAVIETLAIMTGDMSTTLSGHLRLWLGLEPGKPWGAVGGIAFLAGLTWAGWHIVIDRDKK